MKNSADVERLAPLFYVGPIQINDLVPDSTAVGPATVTVISEGQVTAIGAENVELVAPGPHAITLYGTGIRRCSGLAGVTAKIGAIGARCFE